jgi:hypothetical protein
MLSNKKLNFTLKNQKKLRFIFYFFSFLIISFIFYLSIPKLLTYSTDSIKENLKINNNINIKEISKIEYKIFPTPRLKLLNSNFTIGEKIFEIINSDLEIVLNINQILDFKETNYKKLFINKGSSKINLDNINQLFILIEKNKKKLTFRENNIIFFQKDNIFFEVSDAQIELSQLAKKTELAVNGIFLNNKIFIKLNNTVENENNLKLKIPELDISARVFFKKNNSGNISGFFNLEVLNNFLKFNFAKEANFKLTKGFIRTKLINSSFEGEITTKPNFFSKLDFKPSALNMEKLFPFIQKIYFSNNNSNLSLIKKINGNFYFKSKLEGSISNKNGEILFEEFKVGEDKSLSFSAKIVELGSKGKIQFNLVKKFEQKRNLSKKIEIIGFLIPSNSKVIFKKILLDGIQLSTEKTKEYENKFQNNVIKNSSANIFNENKINKYFKNLL